MPERGDKDRQLPDGAQQLRKFQDRRTVHVCTVEVKSMSTVGVQTRKGNGSRVGTAVPWGEGGGGARRPRGPGRSVSGAGTWVHRCRVVHSVAGKSCLIFFFNERERIREERKMDVTGRDRHTHTLCPGKNKP